MHSLESEHLKGVHFRRGGDGNWSVRGVVKKIQLLREKLLVVTLSNGTDEPDSGRTLTFKVERLATPRVLATGQILILGGVRLQFFATTDNPLVSHLFPRPSVAT